MRSILLLLALIASSLALNLIDTLWEIREVFILQDMIPDVTNRCLLYDKIIVHSPWLNTEIDIRRRMVDLPSIREECELRSLREELRKLNDTLSETVPPIPGPGPDIYIGEAYLYDSDGKVHVRTAGGKRFIFSTANWTVQEWDAPRYGPIAHDINPEP